MPAATFEGFDALFDLLSRKTFSRLRSGQAQEAVFRECVERPVDQHPQVLLPGELQCGHSAGLVREQHRAVFVQVHGQLDDAEVMLRADGRGHLPDSFKAGELRVGGGCREGVGADAVPADAAPGDLRFEMAEGVCDAPVVFDLRRGRVHTVMGRPSQVVLGVVQQIDVDRLESQAFERPRQLVLEELRVDAVLEAVGVRHQFREGPAQAFAPLAERVVFPLKIARLEPLPRPPPQLPESTM
jgi:hypothetical protein